jgi:hypothetical protein
MRGFPDRAVERAQRAVALANELQHPYTMGYALFHAGFLYLLRQEPEPMRDRAVGALDVAEEYDLPIWRAVGTVLLGAAQTDLGHFDAGLAEISDGIAQYQGLRSPPVFWPLLLNVRARACARAGRPADALVFIDEAIELSGGDGSLPPLFFATKGDILRALPEHGAAAAETWFRRAFDHAGEAGVRMPQLRAAMGLCRVQRERGDGKEATELLRATYATFTEGFESPDLVEARALLA